MSITIHSTAIGSWKRIKTQYVALAAGLILAVSAGSLISAQETTTKAPSPSRVPAASPVRQLQPTDWEPRFFLFIVGSQVEADDHLALLTQGLEGPTDTYSFMVVSSAADEALIAGTYQSIAPELAAIGTHFSMIDLRKP
jgi:hypothetical protein